MSPYWQRVVGGFVGEVIGLAIIALIWAWQDTWKDGRKR